MNDCDKNWFEGREVVQKFLDRVTEEHGDILGEKIARALFEETGGQRLRMPTLQTLYKNYRDEKIRNLFNGFNLEELAIRFSLTKRQIRNIVNV